MDKWTYKPKGNRVIVRPVEQKEEKMVGGIVIPSVADHLQVGEIIVAGKGEYAPSTGVFIPTEVVEGELVLYRKEAPCIPLLDGTFLMREGDIESGVEIIEE